MIRSVLLVAVATLLCTPLLGPSALSLAAEEVAEPQPWGTWVWRTLTPGGAAVPALVTLHKDGTVAVSDLSMFGGLPGSAIRATPLSGVWERTGPHAIGGTPLYLVFNSTTNLLIGYGRVRTALEFPAGVQGELQGTMFLDFLACPTPFSRPDPQDPSAAWQAFNPLAPSFVVSATRLRRVEAGPL